MHVKWMDRVGMNGEWADFFFPWSAIGGLCLAQCLHSHCQYFTSILGSEVWKPVHGNSVIAIFIIHKGDGEGGGVDSGDDD